jgi:hypothetical protein
MCDPLTIAGVAATAGSMVMNQVAQGKVTKARNGAMEAERIRQKGFDQETDALNLASRERYSDFGEGMEAKATSLGDYFKDQNQAIPQEEGAPTETMPSGSSNIVVQEQKKQNAKAKNFADQQGEALGDLRSFGDYLGGISREQSRDAGQIGTIGGFKRGSQAVLPYELEAANGKGDGLKLFGDLLAAGGSIATSAGLSGGDYNLFGLNPGAASATTAASKVAAPAGAMSVAGTHGPMSIAAGSIQKSPYSLYRF